MKIFSLLADASGTIKSSAGKACGDACGNSDIGVIFGSITNMLIFLVGAISVIMIVVGGLRYALSNGDSKAAGDAKNTILYSVAGIVVAIAAYAIVTFVATSVGKTGEGAKDGGNKGGAMEMRNSLPRA